MIASCGSCTAPQTCGGGGVPGACGCIPEGDAAFCSRLFKNCGTLTADDNCGVSRTVTSCGICSGTGVNCGSGGQPNVCACNAENDAAFCLRLGKNCGLVTANDKCGVERTVVSCGTCSGTGVTCGGGGTPNVCGCTPETDAELCARLYKNCGTLAANDNCGASRSITSCGTCTGVGVSCGGGGTQNVCACNGESDAEFCSRLGKNCGLVTANDKCGTERTVVSCGTCSGTGVTCGGGATANVCGCTPETDAELCSRLGKNCGTFAANDNCGASRSVTSCGTCSGMGETCGGGSTPVPNVCGCTPEIDTAFCQRLGKNCDPLTANDNCGMPRTSASCGTCSGTGVTCGGGGTTNVCGCLPETDAALCLRLTKNCGSLTANDNCGASRTVTSCGTCTSPNTCNGGGTANVCGGGAYDVTPPFVVDDKGYWPGQNNGTWGDWSALASGACSTPARAPGTPGGSCHHWTYTYNATGGRDCNGAALVPPATACPWTTQAWKATTTKTIAPGATKIQFYAWGSGTVSFAGAGQPGLQVTLTGTPTQYVVNITGSYATATDAFSITFTSGNTGAVVNVDDIRWCTATACQ
jgi:hypothetical protein